MFLKIHLASRNRNLTILRSKCSIASVSLMYLVFVRVYFPVQWLSDESFSFLFLYFVSAIDIWNFTFRDILSSFIISFFVLVFFFSQILFIFIIPFFFYLFPSTPPEKKENKKNVNILYLKYVMALSSNSKYILDEWLFFSSDFFFHVFVLPSETW